MTVEELYALPDDGRHYELVCGLLVSEPLPGGRHGRIAARIAAVLDGHVRGQRIGVVLTCDTGFILHRAPDTMRGPDVAFVRRERYAALEDESKAIPGPPDLAVEVLSPSNGPAEVRAKVADDLAAGALLVWVVDPETETVASYRKLLEPRVTGREGVLGGADVLPGLELPVADIFDA
jgi:Uma2 family endonuclease